MLKPRLGFFCESSKVVHYTRRVVDCKHEFPAHTNAVSLRWSATVIDVSVEWMLKTVLTVLSCCPILIVDATTGESQLSNFKLTAQDVVVVVLCGGVIGPRGSFSNLSHV